MHITWEQYDAMINKLYRRVQDQDYDIIIGVTIISQQSYQKALIVDDICDTGDTIRGLSEVFKNTDFAVLIDKTGDSMVKYRAEYFEADDWVVFPWEQ